MLKIRATSNVTETYGNGGHKYLFSPYVVGSGP